MVGPLGTQLPFQSRVWHSPSSRSVAPCGIFILIPETRSGKVVRFIIIANPDPISIWKWPKAFCFQAAAGTQGRSRCKSYEHGCASQDARSSKVKSWRKLQGSGILRENYWQGCERVTDACASVAAIANQEGH